MLSSIHPLGERARHNSFGVTVTAFVAGNVAGGAAVGAVAGTIGTALTALTGFPGTTGAAFVVAGAAVIAAGFEGTGRALPSLPRQVDERWLDIYRNWVYGLGYGVQLGAGVVTHITTAAVHVVIVAAVLVGDVRASVLIVGLFGLVRGLSLLPARVIRSTERLVDLFQTLERRARTVRLASTATLTTTGVLASVVLL